MTLVAPAERGWTRPLVGAPVLTAATAGTVDCQVEREDERQNEGPSQSASREPERQARSHHDEYRSWARFSPASR